MTFKKMILALVCIASPIYAEQNQQLERQIELLQKQTTQMQSQLSTLQQKLTAQKRKTTAKKQSKKTKNSKVTPKKQEIKKVKVKKYHSSNLTVHTPDEHPESVAFYPTALVADGKIVTYIAGTPVVTSPFLGDRPAFDGSDYLVNISSINRDVRLLQQRRRLYDAYKTMGYPIPDRPILALSGKGEPVGMVNSNYMGNTDADFTLGSSEVDVAAALNENVEAYMSIVYDASPPEIGPRTDNSAFNLNLGFVNIGNLDKTPFYFSAGQLYVPFGRYSSSMISAPLPLSLSRTKTRPFILGYKSQGASGPFVATYLYRSDTTLGKSGVGGGNIGYVFSGNDIRGEFGTTFISSVDDADGMQFTAGRPGTFGGFASLLNGNERVRKTQALDFYGNLNYDRYSITLEWAGVTQPFRTQDLSFNGRAAKPQAFQSEVGMTFKAFNKPASINAGYQWSKDALALNIPEQRIIGVFNISIWKDTVESLEYRHDMDYGAKQYANGAAPAGLVNAPTLGTGRAADTVSVQLGVYF